MPKTFTINVIETRTYYIDYTVEAGSPDEALEKALEGDTIYEDEMNKQFSGVSDRYATLEDVQDYGHWDDLEAHADHLKLKGY